MNPRAAARAALAILLVAAALLGIALGAPETASADGTLTADSVAITSDPGPDNEYHAGDTITATVTFSAPITSHANAALVLNIGSAAPVLTIEAATLTPPANTLDYSYVVSHDMQDSDGITVPGTMSGNYEHGSHTGMNHSITTLANPLTTPQAGHLVNVNTTDYDTDDDGLIEIDSLAQLNAVRWDSNGNGELNLSDHIVDYAAAFPKRAHYNGCPDTATDADTDPGPCLGYELTANLDFDTNGNGEPDAGDAYYGASGHGWVPITYNGRLVGNGHTIANLFINLPTTATNPERVGLFGTLESGGSIRGLGVTNASVTRYRSGINAAGALVGYNQGTITGSWSTGAVLTSHTRTAGTPQAGTGGLVGINNGGTIRASWSSASATARGSAAGQGGIGGVAGGLVGFNDGTIIASYATGAIHATGDYPNAGGLAGYQQSGSGKSLTYSYATGAVSASAGSGTLTSLGGLVGRSYNNAVQNNHWNRQSLSECGSQSASSVTCRGSTTGRLTTAQMQSPTNYGAASSDPYYNWNVDLDGVVGGDDPWNFGTASQYPVLHYGGNTLEAQGRSAPTDYDTDDDGLIEINSLAQLDAIRHDADGDGGKVLHADYRTAFPNRDTAEPGRMGCPEGVCVGYELARNLDFDTGAAGDRTDDTYYGASGHGWVPIATYSGRLVGNSHTIANLYINLPASAATPTLIGLFGTLASGGAISGVGITDASVTRAISSAQNDVGTLVGRNQGTITGSWGTGAVSVTSASPSNFSYPGGLVGDNRGTLYASWAAAAVMGSNTGGTVGGVAGGLAGTNTGTIAACYATGAVTATSTTTGATGSAGGLVGYHAGGNTSASYAIGRIAGTTTLGGLVGVNTAGTFNANNYFDSQTTGRQQSGSANGTAKTTAELQNPTAYAGIYTSWNVRGDDPWNFGTDSQYPVLHYGGNNLEAQGRSAPTDYDTDNDGLIDIRSLAQLSAIRHDLDGDGGKALHSDYAAAFPNRNSVAAGRMGCPDGACAGYELMDDLDFASAAAYANWTPIGTAGAPYAAVFRGNGLPLANLAIDASNTLNVGLFGVVSGADAVIESVALTDVSITATYTDAATGTYDAGALAGDVAGAMDTSGAVRTSYATGEITVTAAGAGATAAGGLVGRAGAGAAITASYAAVNVTVSSESTAVFADVVGGLVGFARGSVTAAYATGQAASGRENSLVGGLIGDAVNATISASYWDTSSSRIADDADADPPEGKSASALQSPTGYRGIYAAWDDHDLDGDGSADAPWDFGDACQYPALEFGGHRPARQRGDDPPCPSGEYVAPPIVYNLNIRFSVKGLTLDEGESATYQVRMSQAPAGHPARVAITSNNPDVVVSPTSLTFSSANYSQWQRVKVTTLRDPNDTDESAHIAHRGPNLSYGAIIVEVNDTWPGAATSTVNGHTVTLRHTLDAPYGVTVTPPATLDVATHITIAGPPADTPAGAPGYGLGQSAAARMLADIQVRGTPADGLAICLPLPPALLSEAGEHPLALLRYADGSWTPVAGAARRDGADGAGTAMLCAAGVTEYGTFAAAYALPELGAVADLAAAPGATPGTIALTWTPGANAAVHWVAGVKQSDPRSLAVWTVADAAGAHTASGLDAGETYIFTVTAGRGEGAGSQWTAWAPWVYATPAAPESLVRIGSAVYAVDLATTEPERRRGLSGRPTLAAARGMLFVFDGDGPRAFWMLNMRFPLDLVWIRADCAVAGVTADVPHPAPDVPRSELPEYHSTGPVRFVLEINAGQAAEHSIAPGVSAMFDGAIAGKWGC